MFDTTSTACAEPATRPEALLDIPTRLIDIDELRCLLGCGKTKIYADLADPKSSLPRPVKHGRSTRWVLGEVMDYIASLVAQRDLAQRGVQ